MFDESAKMQNSRDMRVLIGFPVLLLMAAVALWPGVHGPFLFDDIPNLKNLSELNSHPTWRSIGVYLSLFPGTPGRPLATLSFLLNDVDWPSDPYGFKVTNVLIHLLNGVLVFGLARTLSRLVAGNDRNDPGLASDWIGLACAALWLLSPIQISAVFLTVQRMTELAATFAFAGIWAFLVLARRAHDAWRACLAVGALGIFTLLSFLSKENGALTPLLALVAFATLLRQMLAGLPRTSRWILVGVPVLPSLFVIGYLVRRILIAGDGHFAGRSFGLWERLMTEPRVLIDYITLIVVPRLSSSSLYNDDYVISRGLLEPATTLPAILAVVGLAIAGWYLRRRKPVVSFGILWFLAGHLLESTTIGLEIYFEHRNYLPLFGPAFAVAHTVVAARGKLRHLALASLSIWLVLALGITHLQAKAWGSEQRLATFWHLEHPESLRAQQYYAGYLASHGHVAEAREVMARIDRRQASPFDSALQVMTLDCDAGRAISPSRVDEAMALADGATPTPGTAMILGRMRRSVQAGNCPDSIPPATWLAFTGKVLENRRGRGVHRMLRVERAELYLAANQLDAALDELEHAYGKGRNAQPRVAFYAAALLATAGRYDEARTWARRPLSKPWTLKEWLAQTDRQAQEMLEAIDQGERQATMREDRCPLADLVPGQC